MIVLTGMEGAVVLLLGSVSGSTRLKPHELTGSSSPRSQPVNLHRHPSRPLDRSSYPRRTEERDTSGPGFRSPTGRQGLERLTFESCQETLVDTCDISVLQFYFAILGLFVLERRFYACLQITKRLCSYDSFLFHRPLISYRCV